MNRILFCDLPFYDGFDWRLPQCGRSALFTDSQAAGVRARGLASAHHARVTEALSGAGCRGPKGGSRREQGVLHAGQSLPHLEVCDCVLGKLWKKKTEVAHREITLFKNK